jgi:cytochrome c-type biogenesis protein CcmH/NrfG
VRAFAASLSTRPDFHEAAFNLGVAHQEAGDLEAALDAYSRAWRLRPGSFGRIAQALVSPAVGRLWLRPSALERELAARA